MFNAARREVLMGAAMAALSARTAVGAAGTSVERASAVGKAGAWLEGVFATRPAPAISVAVANPDGLVWAGTAGVANLELAVPARTDTLFPLGSISKVVTSTLAARLALRGVLDLDAPISAAMPGLPAQHRDTTLRQLLTHRAGIRHFSAAEADMGTNGSPVFMRVYRSEDDVLALFINDPLVAPPGTAVNYSSYGYTLASMVMAATSGRAFLDLVEAEIAIPFNVPSLVPDDPWRITPHRAAGYMNDLDLRMFGAGLPEGAKPKLDNGWANLPFNNSAYSWSGAGFLMTPSDTARFGAAMIDSQASVLNEAERALLFTPVTVATKSSPPLGLGWRIDTDKTGRRRWHHAGATPGGCQLLVVYPDQRLSVAIAGNVMTMKMNLLQGAAELIEVFTE
ncbi:beta-lactamase family protein [Sphingomonas suaedae]|uniref:Beta-lactamase family protein n=1 Tax=Sphingomonas suaedae TaxID=2599297 RepID=A0A518REU6_9SPHN|nr:serine hydrolase domain-containing protein [Sphingomonas suaedae]QDX25992.1 beta-lactamase family protein [Sphingomonas suaedae]